MPGWRPPNNPTLAHAAGRQEGCAHAWPLSLAESLQTIVSTPRHMLERIKITIEGGLVHASIHLLKTTGPCRHLSA
jgi:hypothetical protein